MRQRHEGEHFLTPESIGPAQWNSLTALLLTLWLFALATTVFSLSLLLAHAVVPSLDITGQLPSRAGRLRPVLYVVALAALGIDVWLALRLGGQLGIIKLIYPKFLI